MSKLSAGLREAADLIDANPEFVEPYLTTSHTNGVSLKWYLDIEVSKDEQRAVVKRMIRAVGGKWDKAPNEFDPRDFRFTQKRGHLDLQISVSRESVCEKVVIGTEEVTVPAKPASEAVPERVEEREVVEWRCESVLA